MPRLLLLCEYPTLNGGERSMLATLPRVQEAGFTVAAAAPPEGPLAEALGEASVDVVPFSRRARPDQAAGAPPARLRERLAEVLRRHRPDLLHANSLAMGRLAGPVAAGNRVRSLCHLRDILRLTRGAVADLNRHTRLLAVSRATRDYHVAAGLDAGKTFVVHNGVDLDAFRPRPASGILHRALGLPRHAHLALTVGQVGLRKGQDVLLRAAAALADRLPRLDWLLVGRRHSGKEEARRFEAELHAAAAAGPLAGRVHFLGVRRDVPAIMNEALMLVHPARQEPLGRVLLEAAASGLAVVATDVGGTREVFPPQAGAALLVAPDDPDALAAAVARAAGDEALRGQLGRAARRRAEEAFSVEGAAESLLGHYRAALR